MKTLYSVLLIGLLIASPAFSADDREKLAQDMGGNATTTELGDAIASEIS